MTAPNCKTHQTPMRAGKDGGWFCPRKVGEGWCKEKIAAPKPQPAAAGQVPSGAHAVTDLVIVSYDMAAQILRGTACDAMELSTLALAIRNAIKADQAKGE